MRTRPRGSQFRWSPSEDPGIELGLLMRYAVHVRWKPEGMDSLYRVTTDGLPVLQAKVAECGGEVMGVQCAW